ncbi:hypothetical protein AB0I77_23105, partial [Streptomyces sp. NPDC050619]
LQRVFYTSALVSVRYDPNSRKFYDRKRAEGKIHTNLTLSGILGTRSTAESPPGLRPRDAELVQEGLEGGRWPR